MVQNGSNMAPKSTQVGAMLGSKTVMDPPKSEAKTMSKKCLQKIDFFSHLGGILGRYKKKTYPGGVDPNDGWIANLQELARIGKNWHGVQHSCTPFGGAPDPLALRANPATVPAIVRSSTGSQPK